MTATIPSPNIPPRLQTWIQLARLDKPIGIYLLLWPTLWGLWVAGQGHVPGHILIIFIAGTVLMRTIGCIINDLADRHIDPHVQRTRSRPLASGALQPRHAFMCLCLLGMMAASLLLALPPQCLPLAIFALALATFYPFCKRFFVAPQVILGLAFAWGIPMAFAALQTAQAPATTIAGMWQPAALWQSLVALGPSCWWLYTIAAIWPIAYDTVYALMDQTDDQRIGVQSTAITFGQGVTHAILGLQACVLLGWMAYAYHQHFGLAPWLAACVGMVFWYDLKCHLAQGITAAYARAFQRQHWLGTTLWLSLVWEYAMR